MAPPYESLEVWQLSHDLALKVYQVTSRFPDSEKYGLVSQIRRAAVAIPTNVVEGNARRHRREYVQFCHVARASAVEVRYLLRLSLDLGFLSREDFDVLDDGYDRVSKMLYGLTKSLAMAGL